MGNRGGVRRGAGRPRIGGVPLERHNDKFMSDKCCVRCGNKIPEDRAMRHSIFCTNDCRNKRQNEQYQQFKNPQLTTGTKGAFRELIVAADLMSKGIEIYRAMSPSSSCDLVAKHRELFYGVEVKTAVLRRNIQGIIISDQKLRSPILVGVCGLENELYYTFPGYVPAEMQKVIVGSTVDI